MRDYLGKAITLIVVLGVLAIGARSCVVPVWQYPAVATTYDVEGADGRTMSMVLLPSRETIVAYADSANGAIEVIRARFRGTLGTHYVGPVWNVSVEGHLFGLRLYPQGISPVDMEVEIQRKYRFGRGESVFRTEGTTSREIVLYSTDSLRFGGTWLYRTETDSALVEGLRALIAQ
jgi:hypothetical protein